MAIEIIDNGLRELSRKELQALAKLHGIKANQKNRVIIEELVKKGVKNEKLFPQDPEPQVVTEDLYGGLMDPEDSPVAQTESQAEPPAAVSDTQRMAEQFLSQISQTVERNLRLPGRGASSLATADSLSSPGRYEVSVPMPDHRWEQSVSNHRMHTHPLAPQPVVPVPDDSMDLPDYEDVMIDSEAQEPVVPPFQHTRTPPVFTKVQPFVAPPTPMHQQQQRHTPPPVAGPSRPLYTPNGKHVYTDDPKQRIAPRCFYHPDDPKLPSANHRPPTRKTARRYLRECEDYIQEGQELRVQLRDIRDLHAMAKMKLNMSERRIARIQKARVVIQKHWMQMLKADSRLHDGSWSWKRPKTAEQEAVPLPTGPPKWIAGDYSDLDSPDEDFEMAEEEVDRHTEKFRGVKRSRAQEAQFERAVDRFEAWISRKL